ncbi:HIT family protein [Streptomyces griseoviridis]|uniref:HIT family protein n=2 Tax=Streptomyces TaxID=1883 RepID=A0A3Q9KWG0_STRGD|nr:MULTISPECIES: HIT family protein [Streptomyces]AZS86050.1 HIT family protein [Streptomyces griseoviridis]MDH6703091.1 ATP adenylyltransferase [Streptomyces sp. MAA16]MDT0474395.1 HIT family protein [Streptomyces sp. DSM 41014]QCN87090.1 HIT family protein [Streptomyces griseoviridis]
MSLYYFGNCRTEEQRAEMERLDRAGVCLFCPDVIRAHEKQQIVAETGHWIVTPNEFPYAGARLHLLLIPKEHVTDLVELSVPARADLFEALRWVKDTYGLDHYGLGARNGDSRFTGGTIRHLHLHVLVGEGDEQPGGAGDFTPVRMKFSSRPKDR